VSSRNALGEGLVATIFFFFQAEDGIRDYKVTGVQTCALPILREVHRPRNDDGDVGPAGGAREPNGVPAEGIRDHPGDTAARVLRSEERRVGKERRSLWWRHQHIERQDLLRSDRRVSTHMTYHS